jgi:hypothetical protein
MRAVLRTRAPRVAARSSARVASRVETCVRVVVVVAARARVRRRRRARERRGTSM